MRKYKIPLVKIGTVPVFRPEPVNLGIDEYQGLAKLFEDNPGFGDYMHWRINSAKNELFAISLDGKHDVEMRAAVQKLKILSEITEIPNLATEHLETEFLKQKEDQGIVRETSKNQFGLNT